MYGVLLAIEEFFYRKVFGPSTNLKNFQDSNDEVIFSSDAT